MLSKKNLSFIMVIVLLLSIISCKNNKDADEEKDKPSLLDKLLLLESEDGEEKVYASQVEEGYFKKLGFAVFDNESTLIKGSCCKVVSVSFHLLFITSSYQIPLAIKLYLSQFLFKFSQFVLTGSL